MIQGVRGPQGILLPDGSLAGVEKDVIPLREQEVRMLAWLHEWAHHQQVNVFCKKCEKAITGQNNDSSPYVSVSCQCREWRFSR
jgi:hypothetical protein